jgi:hypothetical protein
MGLYHHVKTDNMKTLVKINFLFLLLISCNNLESATTLPTAVILPTGTATPQPSIRQNEIMAIWEDGGHANVTEPVGCEACHKMQNGVVLENAEWQDLQSGQHETVINDDSLCGRCHEESVGENVHTDFTCIHCHDPHNTIASCTASGCHSTMQSVFYEVPPTPADGHPETGSSFCGGSNCHAVATAVSSDAVSIHGSIHGRLSCMACHDASGMQTGPSNDRSTWGLWRELESGEIEPGFSHIVQREVDCGKCHFEENPWGLYLVTGSEFTK